VLDATRFAFTSSEPELWIGTDDEYDVGGSRFYAQTGLIGDPPNPFETDRNFVQLELASASYVAELLSQPTEFWGEDWIDVSVEQMFWIANLPVLDREGPRNLAEFFVREVYEALARAGQKAAIPIDRWNAYMEVS